MASDGYIKLYRKMIDWGWYDDPAVKCVFLHLLLSAQYEPCYYRGIQLDTGQAATSIRELSAKTGISVRSVRTAINKLKSTHEVTQQIHGKYSVFTVNKYAEYQSNDTRSDKQATQQRHNSDTTATQTLILRNQEVKKSRKKKDISSDISQKAHGEFDNVKLTGEEYNKLVDSMGDIGAAEYIERLSAYIAQSGKTYKNHYATMLNWWRKDGKPAQRTKCIAPMLPDEGRDITPDITAEELF